MDVPRSRVAVSFALFFSFPLIPSAAFGQDPNPRPVEAFVEILSSDERLGTLSAEDRAQALDEAARYGSQCEYNVTLAAHYDCACFAGAMLGFRFEAGFEVTVTRANRGWPDIAPRMQEPLPECLSAEKLTAYTTRTVPNLIIGGDAEEAAALTPCVVEAVVTRYETEFGTPALAQAHPGLLMEAIGKALTGCRNPSSREDTPARPTSVRSLSPNARGLAAGAGR